jgi:hypothetical protein
MLTIKLRFERKIGKKPNDQICFSWEGIYTKLKKILAYASFIFHKFTNSLWS